MVSFSALAHLTCSDTVDMPSRSSISAIAKDWKRPCSMGHSRPMLLAEVGTVWSIPLKKRASAKPRAMAKASTRKTATSLNMRESMRTEGPQV